MNPPSLPIQLALSHYQGNRRISDTPIRSGDAVDEWQVAHRETGLPSGAVRHEISLRPNAPHCAVNLRARIAFDPWTDDVHLMAPAGLYDGNQFPCSPQSYPPMLPREKRTVNPSLPVITDVPRLDGNGNHSQIEFVAGDLAVPALCAYFPASQKSVFLLTPPECAQGPTGLAVEHSPTTQTCDWIVSSPCVKNERQYRICSRNEPSEYAGVNLEAGEEVTIQFDLLECDTSDLMAFYNEWFGIWSAQAETVSLENTFPFSAAWELYEGILNDHQWNDAYGYYRVGVKRKADQDHPHQDWQPGWVGGGMNSLPALQAGSGLSQSRARKTIDTLTGTGQFDSGFFSSNMHLGTHYGDDFDDPEDLDVHLARKSADVLVYLLRHIELLEKRNEAVPEPWLESVKSVSDVFCKLWETYAQFGQHVGALSGDIKIGGSPSAIAAVAGLAQASVRFKRDDWMQVAKDAGEMYVKTYLHKGITTGGPGEILQCPDSESSYAFVEACMTLHDMTQEKQWLRYAEQSAWQYSSWVMNYDFNFPASSEFGRLDKKSAGAVFANVQNKHGSPGICTFSGHGLLKLYRATNNPAYLRLLQLTAHNITQYFSREDAVLHDRGNGRDFYPGMMCERVNTSDWEGKDYVGSVFFGQCWCSVSAALTYTEIPGVYVEPDQDRVTVFDHVEARLENGVLHLHNPTPYPATLRILVETRAAQQNPLPPSASLHWPGIRLESKASTTFKLPAPLTVQEGFRPSVELP